MSTKTGIDVSEHNGVLDWAKVKATGVEFAILRSGYGKKAVDGQFAANLRGAEANGVPYGVYHYSYALTQDDAKREAELALQLLDGKRPAYPVWFDMEDADGYKAKRMTLTKAAITGICKTFVEAVQAAGYTCGVYANKHWLETYIDVAQLGGCPIWLAQWASKPTWTGSYDLWQYTDSGKLAGLSGSFDMNMAYADYGTVVNSAEAAAKLAAAGVVNTPAYWVAHAGDLPYLDTLLAKLAAACGSAVTAQVVTVEAAITRLTEKQVLDTGAYWLANYAKVPYLDQRLINGANHV